MNLKSVTLIMILAILALAMWVFFTANPSSAPIALPTTTPSLEPPPQNEAVGSGEWPPLSGLATFGDQIKLLAFTLPTNRLASGDMVDVTLYWQTQTVADVYLFLHLFDGDNQLVVQVDAPLAHRVCAADSHFSTGLVVTCDPLVLPESLAAGEYQLLTGLYNPVTGQRLLSVTGDSSFLLTPIEVDASMLTSAATPLPPCPATSPNGSIPPGEQPSPDQHGNGQLWTGLWSEGKVIFEPGGPGTIYEDGSLGMKWWWWRGVEGQLSIEGRRLDASAPPLQADIPEGYGNIGFQAAGLIFPSEGCWGVTGTVGDAELTFVTLVVKKGQN